MGKTINTRLIKSNDSYSTKEICETCKVHKRTVQAWKKEGLTGISQIPFLVMGCELKRFIDLRQSKRKCRVLQGQIYCVKCKQGMKPKDNNVYLNYTGKTIGKDNLKEFIVKGNCERCNSRLNRFSHEGKLLEIKEEYNIIPMSEVMNNG